LRPTSLISLPPSALLLIGAAQIETEAVALSLLVAMPLQIYVALRFIRIHGPFQWGEFFGAVAPSVVVTACSAVLPALVLAAAGLRFDVPVGVALVAALGAVAGWAAELVLVRHSLVDEIRRVVPALCRAGPAGDVPGLAHRRLNGQ
jgi:O-antigen/teichoic acid export membrane protein